MKRLTAAVAIVAALISSSSAFAWGNTGHRQTGWIADALLTDAARDRVHAILGYDLGEAALWADCAKSVEKTPAGFVWKPDRNERLTCKTFDTADETRRMEDYVARNWATCPAHKSCHKKYHFADIATGHDRYDPTYEGAEPYDIVVAINSAITFLQTGSSPGPISIKDDKEAILLLAHFVGDLHQPLHVGSVYLRADGRIVPIATPEHYDPSAQTQGGNSLYMGTQGLHAYWDGVADGYKAAPTVTTLNAAKATPASTGPITSWPTQWATDGVLQAKDAFDKLTFGQQRTFQTQYGSQLGWPAYYPPGVDYSKRRRTMQTAQLAKGGARLAALLSALNTAGDLS